MSQADSVLMVDDEKRVPMAGCDHRDIVRFEDVDQEGYKVVVGYLRTAVREALRSTFVITEIQAQECLT